MNHATPRHATDFFNTLLGHPRIELVIPTRKDQPRQPEFDEAAYRERNKVDRLMGRLQQYRRIAAHYERKAVNYHAMVTPGKTMLWLIDLAEMP